MQGFSIGREALFFYACFSASTFFGGVIGNQYVGETLRNPAVHVPNQMLCESKNSDMSIAAWHILSNSDGSRLAACGRKQKKTPASKSPYEKISRAGANTTTTFVSPPVMGFEYFCVIPQYNFTIFHLGRIRICR